MVRLDCLRRGVTGFDKPNGTSVVVPSRFKAACYLVARHVHGHVETFESYSGKVAINYHAATLSVHSGGLSVLCNWLYPFLAFVPPGSYGLPQLAFLPPGDVGLAFAELTEFRPLDPALLQTVLTSELQGELGPSELKQLHYWKRCSVADRVGDVVFNIWD